MKMTMRWFGDGDAVRLQDIAQISVVRGIVGTIEEKTEYDVWTEADFASLRQKVNAHGFSLDVIESIRVGEAIKKGSPERDALIDIFCESIRNMGRAGIPVLCYNFMPVFDWMRTDMKSELADGSYVTAYEHQAAQAYDLRRGLEMRVAWARGFTGDELRVVLDEYKAIDEAALFENLAYFLRRVVPVAEESGVYLAIHPDDPPWSIFGLPRIVRDAPTIQRILDVVESPHNGLTFCTGSLGTLAGCDLVSMVHQFAGRIHFVHLRNVELTGEQSFREIAHTQPTHVNLPAVMRALVEIGYTGPLRPDHGRAIWGETGRTGYGLYDRALAVMYLYGLWQGVERQREQRS
ncbi:MAG: mannonate dehydratase [Anaerolineae bacterium]|nr:mannonate dehydratase [Anaerolineae bacterium]NUQ04071.1 mannonate dehydratase [Anaerolineae bacterium]